MMRITQNSVSVQFNKMLFVAVFFFFTTELISHPLSFFPPAKEILRLQTEVDQLGLLIFNTKTTRDSRLKGEWLYDSAVVAKCVKLKVKPGFTQ